MDVESVSSSTRKAPRIRFSGFLREYTTMGFDTDRFTEDVNDALTCCICRDVLEDPVQAPCEHAYCRTCIEGWLVHENICPEDRKPLSMSSLRPLFRYMKNDLNKLQIKCKNRSIGCHHIGDLEFIEIHERDCAFEKVKCPYERCSAYVMKAELSEHRRTCDKRLQECPNGCGLLIIRPEDREHNCVSELRTAIEVLRSEMTCKYDEQKREMDLRLDMQRGHMVQKEAALQSQVDALKSENSRISQNVKLLMDMELQRRQDIERLELEKKELMELLKESSRPDTRRRTGRDSELPSGPRNISSNSGRGKVTTL